MYISIAMKIQSNAFLKVPDFWKKSWLSQTRAHCSTVGVFWWRKHLAVGDPTLTCSFWMHSYNLNMETVTPVLTSIRKGDIMLSLCILSDPVYPESRLYLCFILNGMLCQFKALCFGISIAHQGFTTVFTLILTWSHQGGIHILYYLDNSLVITDFTSSVGTPTSAVLQRPGDQGITLRACLVHLHIWASNFSILAYKFSLHMLISKINKQIWGVQICGCTR